MEAPEDEAEGDREIRAKDKVEFKNVPQVLIDLVENPPNIEEPESDDEADMQTQIESLVFGDTKEGCLSKKVFGYLLSWCCLLQKIDNGGVKAQLFNRDDYTAILGTVLEYFEQNKFTYEMLLVIIVAYLPKAKKVGIPHQEIVNFDVTKMAMDDPYSAKLMALFTLVSFMKSFPSLARKYYQECDKKLLEIVMPYIKQVVSPSILENEILKIEMSQVTLRESGSGEGLTFQLFKSTKEIEAKYE